MKPIYIIMILLFLTLGGTLSSAELTRDSSGNSFRQSVSDISFISVKSHLTLLADDTPEMGSVRKDLIRNTITWFAFSAVPFGASAALYVTLIGLTVAPYAPYIAAGYTIVYSTLEIVSFVLGSIFGTITMAVGVGFIIMGILSAQKLVESTNTTTIRHDDLVPTLAMGFLL